MIEAVPSSLRPSNMDRVASLMLGVGSYTRTAVLSLPTTDRGYISPELPGLDTSFAAQMDEVMTHGAPDAFFLTSRSAIPVADAIRGFYEARGLEEPLIAPVNSNKTMDYYHMRTGMKHPKIQREVQRLSDLMPSRVETATVVDQYVNRGNTIRLAGKMLQAAGIEIITGIQGRWYEDATSRNVNMTRLSSRYAHQMHEIGLKAGTLY
jgi:hypothetical protein